MEEGKVLWKGCAEIVKMICRGYRVLQLQVDSIRGPVTRLTKPIIESPDGTCPAKVERHSRKERAKDGLNPSSKKESRAHAT